MRCPRCGKQRQRKQMNKGLPWACNECVMRYARKWDAQVEVNEALDAWIMEHKSG